MTVASLAFLLAGIAWPQAADALFRTLLVTLAAGFVAGRVYEALMPVRTRRDVYSPFDGPAAARTPPAAPQAVRKLTMELRAADDARRAQRTPIPWPVRQALIEEASRRMSGRRGLSLGDLDHHPSIRALVSEPTWILIGPRDPEPRAGTRSTPHGSPISLSQLGLILDDLERL